MDLLSETSSTVACTSEGELRPDTNVLMAAALAELMGPSSTSILSESKSLRALTSAVAGSFPVFPIAGAANWGRGSNAKPHDNDRVAECVCFQSSPSQVRPRLTNAGV